MAFFTTPILTSLGSFIASYIPAQLSVIRHIFTNELHTYIKHTIRIQLENTNSGILQHSQERVLKVRYLWFCIFQWLANKDMWNACKISL